MTFAEIISNFSKCKILVIGDLMIDEYLWGTVDRISPEAPVQVVAIENENFTLGGAGNVANNLGVLGAKVYIAGVCGPANDGKIMVKKFEKIGVNTDGIYKEKNRRTTRKTRIIAANQHVLRVDRETIKKVSTDTYEKLKKYFATKISGIDLILISDYGKGMITKELISFLVESAKKYNKPIIADPKGSDYSKYSGINLLTPNKKEAIYAAGIEGRSIDDVKRAGNKLLDKIDIKSLLITCGKDGMLLFERGKLPYKIDTVAKQVFDVSGAGDTVISVIGLVLAMGEEFTKAAQLANIAAGIVVGKVGTATITTKELLAQVK